MSTGFIGADPQELLALAGNMREAAGKLDDTARILTIKVNVTMGWNGPDAARFKGEWMSRHAPKIAGAVTLLRTTADRLVKQAHEQIAVSAAGSMSIPVMRGSFGGSIHVPVGPAAGSNAEDVKKWWDSRTAGEQADYIKNHPAKAGNTDGIPMASRVEANKITAASRLLEMENSTGDSDEANRERAYLRKVVDGQIQLVAYDPKNGNLIEMIGKLSPETTTVLTYLPGTFAKADEFYKGDTQMMAGALAEADPSGKTVAYVYKNSEFPQDLMLQQSRDQGFALAAGEKLHKFESGLGLEIPTNAQTVAVSHSWGEAAVASSEVYGTHYDTQISLSGALMPDNWVADPKTAYHHFGYDFDALRSAQEANLVAKQYPGNDPSFVQHIYDDPNDNFQIGPLKVTTNPMAKLENHNLIANAEDPRNRQVVKDIEKVIYK